MEERPPVDVLDNNCPLRVRLRERAPGTEKHSANVTSLLVAVASEIQGLDLHKLRIAGTYHDIGKTENPRYFIENQRDGEENPHDKVEPWVSYRFITAHVGATAAILINDPNIPREVVEWCTQHHGTTVVRFFKDKSGGTEDDYRYQATKPQSLEAALLMLCDIAEATSRSMAQASKLEDISRLVEDIYRGLEEDGQLDEVPLKLGDLRKARKIIARELQAQYHKRIDYDRAKKKDTSPTQE